MPTVKIQLLMFCQVYNYDEFKVGSDIRHLVVAGDAKTYAHLQSLKLDYGSDLDWLIPFPGDWHI